MVFSVFLLWFAQFIFLGSFHQEYEDNISKQISVNTQKIYRSESEVNFIKMDYGNELPSKKLTKKEKLSLALTNAFSDNE